MTLIALALGQPGNLSSGNWIADYHGTTYVRLSLADSTGTEGKMSIGETLHVDTEGNVDRVTAASATLNRMLDARWNGAVLSFGINAGGDVERFEFRLLDANHAQLTPVISEDQRQELAVDHIPLPKPFPLTRTR